jgi:hypothetical protein
MAKNTNNGYRQGLVKNRTQSYNEKTGKWIKRDKKTGRILKCKDTPFKNIIKRTKKK